MPWARVSMSPIRARGVGRGSAALRVFSAEAVVEILAELHRASDRTTMIARDPRCVAIRCARWLGWACAVDALERSLLEHAEQARTCVRGELYRAAFVEEQRASRGRARSGAATFAEWLTLYFPPSRGRRLSDQAHSGFEHRGLQFTVDDRGPVARSLTLSRSMSWGGPLRRSPFPCPSLPRNGTVPVRARDLAEPPRGRRAHNLVDHRIHLAYVLGAGEIDIAKARRPWRTCVYSRFVLIIAGGFARRGASGARERLYDVGAPEEGVAHDVCGQRIGRLESRIRWLSRRDCAPLEVPAVRGIAPL